METPPPHPESGEAETPNQKQARLRRERREAKIKAGGSARLEKITNLSGRQNLPDTSPPTHDPDPEEVDLSTHPSASPTPNPGAPPSEADIRALLRSGAPQPGVDTEGPADNNNAAEDPMMKMLSQLMGGGMPGGGDGDGGAGEGGLPPGLAAMLGGGGVPGMGGAQPGKQEGTYAYLWKVVHAVFALALGVYVTGTATAFRGGISRGAEAVGGVAGKGGGVNLFWVFATAELVLQSSRFFLERGSGGGGMSGWMGLVGGFLPEPWKGYVMLVARYARIWSTVVEDAMVVVFVVGCVSWWKGAVG